MLKKVKLGELALVKGGKRLPKGTNLITEPNSHPYIRVRDLNNKSTLELNNDFEYVDDETQKSIARYIVGAGDIVLSIVGTIGLVAIVGESLHKANLTENCVKLTQLDGVDRDYLYYYLKSDLGQAEIAKGTVGAVQAKLPIKNIQDIDIVLPDISTQQKISSILRSIDDKIENNQKINDNLQQQAQALYRDWFIDYKPFGRTPPATWKQGKIKDILQLQKHAIKAGSAPELPYLPIDTIPMKTFAVADFRPNEEAQSSLIRFSKDDILIGAMRVYFHRVIIAPCDGITRTTCFVLKPVDPSYLSFGLLTCDLDSNIDHAQNTSKGSTMPYAVWDGGMGEIEITIPPVEIAEEFNNMIMPMLRQIQNSYFEIKALRELRDSLLPRLMSGALNVSDLT